MLLQHSPHYIRSDTVARGVGGAVLLQHSPHYIRSDIVPTLVGIILGRSEK